MIFRETRLGGAFIIDPERIEDERGFFARTWCAREFATHGLNTRLVQCNASFNRLKGTLRGLHYQAAPHAEAKLVRCTRGAVADVIIDLRRGSPTFTEHLCEILTAGAGRMIYVPEGFAHGFLTMEDACEVSYLMTEFYEPDAARGVRWNDPAFGIAWPGEVRIISARDESYPDFATVE